MRAFTTPTALVFSGIFLASCGGGGDTTPPIDNSNLDIYVGTWAPTDWYLNCFESAVQVLNSAGQPNGLADQSYSITLEKVPGKTDTLRATLHTAFYAHEMFPGCQGNSLASQSLSNVEITLTKDTLPVLNYLGVSSFTASRIHVSSPGLVGLNGNTVDINGLRFPPNYFNTPINYDAGIHVSNPGLITILPWGAHTVQSVNLAKGTTGTGVAIGKAPNT